MQPRSCYSDREKFSSEKLQWGISKSYKCRSTGKCHLFVNSLTQPFARIDYIGRIKF